MKLFTIILLFFCLINTSKDVSAQKTDSSFICLKNGHFYLGNKTGDEDVKPIRKVFISNFYISKYEVTNTQYCDFLNVIKPDNSVLRRYINLKGKFKDIKCRIYFKDNIYYTENGFEYFPVNFVSWFGADAYCKFAGGRLPTEAEWEYAAKGGKQNIIIDIFNKFNYSGSNSPDEVAWYRTNSENHPHRAGKKKTNRANICDMSGNVAEWCSDWYMPDYYKNSPDKNPQGPETGRMKVHRGGSWYNTPKMLRITNRRASKPVTENAVIGFRMVKDCN